MNRLLISIFIFTLLLSNLFSPLITIDTAQAQSIDRAVDSPVVGDVQIVRPANTTGDDMQGMSAEEQAQGTAVSGVELSKAIVNGDKLPAKQPKADCGLNLDPVTWPSGMFCKIISITLLPLASAILAIIARSFDLVVNLSLFTINSAIAENGPAGFIYTSWSMIRDICNMIGLFFFLISCAYMVMDKGLETRKYIVKLIIFAALLNFSFPISKAVLDFSNIFALNMYGAMTDYRYKDNANKGVLWDDYGISFELMKIIGLQDPILKSGDVNPDTPLLSGIDGTFTMLALVVMIMALGVVFAQATAVFMTRTALMFLAIITSPIMFMGGILPPNNFFNMDSLVDWWIKKFVGGAFLAPVMMVNLAIALQIMKFAMGLTSNAKVLPTGDSLIKIVMIVLSIVVFQKAVEYSAKMLDGLGEKAAAIGGKLGGKMMSSGVARPAAFAGRKTAEYAGRGATWLADKTGTSRALTNVAGRDNAAGKMARAALKTIDTGSNAARNSSMNVLGGAVQMASFGKIDNIVVPQGGINRDRIEKEKDIAEAAKSKSDYEAATQNAIANSQAKESNKRFGISKEQQNESETHNKIVETKDEKISLLEIDKDTEEKKVEALEQEKTNIEQSDGFKSAVKKHQLEGLALVEPRRDALWTNNQRAVKEIQKEQDQIDRDLHEYKEDTGLNEINKELSETYGKLDVITKNINKEIISREKVIQTSIELKEASERNFAESMQASQASVRAADASTEAGERSATMAAPLAQMRKAFKEYEEADKVADVNSLSAGAILKVLTEKPKKVDTMTQILETLKKQTTNNSTKSKT